jgi:hypothetical protein
MLSLSCLLLKSQGIRMCTQRIWLYFQGALHHHKEIWNPEMAKELKDATMLIASEFPLTIAVANF